MKTWFISDIHFGHYNVINYSNRPFLVEVKGDKMEYQGQIIEPQGNKPLHLQAQYHSVKIMNNTIINNWNKLVAKEDLVYFVGDFAFLNLEQMKVILDNLNGIKILIKGNHDRSSKQMLSVGFKEVHEELTITLGEEEVVLSHYPYVDLDLRAAAMSRPQILKFTDDPKFKIITKPSGLNYEETRTWLAKYVKFPINTTLPESKDHIIMMQRLISKYIGTRLVNQGKILLHGHTHFPQKRFANMINCSVEAWDYQPASEEQIISLMKEYRKEVKGETLSLETCNNRVYDYYAQLAKDVPEYKEIAQVVTVYRQMEDCLKNQKEFQTQSVPRDYSVKWYELNLQFKGFIAKQNLKHGNFYEGNCRNSSWAYWDQNKGQFFYIRTKFGSQFVEAINTVEDDNGFDLFIPVKETQISDEEAAKFWQLYQP